MRKFGPRLALAVLFGAALTLAGQTTTGKIHGTVTDPSGSQITAGTISLYEGGMASASADPKYSFQVDGTGEYKGEVTPGTYTLVFRSPTTPKNKVVDQIDNVKVTAGGDTVQDDDMSRPDYIAKLSPEDRGRRWRRRRRRMRQF